MKYSRFIKRAVYFEGEKIVALKYDTQNKRVIVSGNKNEFSEMEYLVYQVFEKGRKVINSSKNPRKLKFDFLYTFENFKIKLEELQNRFHIEEVQTFGRLVR